MNTGMRFGLVFVLVLFVLSLAQREDGAMALGPLNRHNEAIGDATSFCSPGSDAEETEWWARTYGWNHSETFTVIKPTADGGYIAAGRTDSFGAGYGEMWVVKLDAAGNIVWQKAYGGGSYETAYAIQQTTDGGYILTGFVYSYSAGQSDFWVLKLDASGNATWQKAYGGSNYDAAYAIQQTTDGGYIVAGDTASSGAGSSDFWVLKLDASGNITWQKTYGGTGEEYSVSIFQTSDGGYIVAGHTQSFGIGYRDSWVLKLDASGSVIWQKTYGTAVDEWAASFEKTAEGGYILVTFFYIGSSWYFRLYKLDAAGGLTWEKDYRRTGGVFMGALTIQQTADGGYILATSRGESNPNAWVLKLDASGDITWQKTYGGAGNDLVRYVQPIAGGYILAGQTSSLAVGYEDGWVLKVDANGDIPGCPLIGTTSAVPYNNNITVSDTSVSGENTMAVGMDTPALAVNTTAISAYMCRYPSQLYLPLIANQQE